VTARPTVLTIFLKCSSNRSNLEMPTLRFFVERKHFENGASPLTEIGITHFQVRQEEKIFQMIPGSE